MIRPELIALYREAKVRLESFKFGPTDFLAALLDEIVILAGDFIQMKQKGTVCGCDSCALPAQAEARRILEGE